MASRYLVPISIVIVCAAFVLGMLAQKTVEGRQSAVRFSDQGMGRDYREFLKLRNDCLGNCSQKSRALSGDKISARAMGLAANKINPLLREYWYQIGAENGDSVSQYNLANLLVDRSSSGDSQRALFWLRMSSKNGDLDAAKFALELEKQSKKGPE